MGWEGVLANGSYSITSSIVSAIICFTFSTSFLCIACKPTEKLASFVDLLGWGGVGWEGVLANGSYSITSSIVSAIICFTFSTSFLCIPWKPTEKLASFVD